MRVKRPTLKTVAEHAGVSFPAVSQVMRGVGRISADTRKRVLDAAAAVGYLPDERAIAVRTGRSREVGIIVHHLTNNFNAELINGVTDRLEKDGYALSVLDARDQPRRLDRHVRSLLSRTRAGLLWVPSEHVDPELVSLIKKQQVPTVTFLRNTGGQAIANLSIANVDATYAATCHLLSLGHTRIAYAGGIGANQTRRARIAGYAKAIKEHAGDPLILDVQDSKHGGFDFAAKLIAIYPEISALVCNGDEFAIGLCLGLQRIGKVPGKDVAVVGFDDIDEAELITPPLTTLAIDPYGFGARLAEMLLLQIHDPSAPIVQEKVQARLVIRETSAVPLD